MKRSSLYKQLLLNITLTLFVGLIALSFINYKVNERKLEETNEWLRKIILRQVSDVMDIYDHGMDLFEKNFDTRMKNVSQQILNYYKGKIEELKKKPKIELGLLPKVQRMASEFISKAKDCFSTYSTSSLNFSSQLIALRPFT